MKFVATLLVVQDIERSKKFYQEFLGQKILMDFGENVGFESGLAIHDAKHFQMLLDGKTTATGGHWGEVYFEHNDLESLEQHFLAAGIEFVHPLREQPWRQRVMRIYDLDKHVIEIGESLEFTCVRLVQEGLTTQKVADTLMMPVEFVETALGKSVK